MKKLFLFKVLLLVAATNQAMAGGEVGGSTEATQILNNVQLADAYAQQAMQYSQQLIQVEKEIANWKVNIAAMLPSDLKRLAGEVAQLQSAGTSIADNMGAADAQFGKMFHNPLAITYSDKFKAAYDVSSDAIHAAMLKAGIQRSNLQSDADNIKTLTENLTASQGTNDALQALGAINAAQLNDSIKLRDLISSQQSATSSWMAAQVAKEKALKDSQSVRFKATPIPNQNNYTSPIL